MSTRTPMETIMKLEAEGKIKLSGAPRWWPTWENIEVQLRLKSNLGANEMHAPISDAAINTIRSIVERCEKRATQIGDTWVMDVGLHGIGGASLTIDNCLTKVKILVESQGVIEDILVTTYKGKEHSELQVLGANTSELIDAIFRKYHLKSWQIYLVDIKRAIKRRLAFSKDL